MKFSCVALGKLFNFSKQKQDNKTLPPNIQAIHDNHLEECLAHSQSFVIIK